MNAAGTLLATGFVVDGIGEGTMFPSAGGNSADRRVQEVYWRCLTVLFASARITNPGQPLALFTNVDLPVVEGIDLASVLDRYEVGVRRVPLTARLETNPTASWGNVLYFFDILASLATEAGDLKIAVLDSDVVVTGALDPLWALLDGRPFAGYEVETGLDDAINGLSRRDMTRIVAELAGAPVAPVAHYGGELLATTVAAWNEHAPNFRRQFAQAAAGVGPARAVRTEEHIFSIAFATLGVPVARANAIMRRIWTSPRFNDVRPGDEMLPLWHVPAEKRYGLRDLYHDLARRGFPARMDAAEFRGLALRRCGLPAKSAAKIARDGIRQAAAKLNLSA